MADKKLKIEVYRETKIVLEEGKLIPDKEVPGDWRWRLRAANGKIIATSGEGYKRKSACLDMAQKITGHIDLVVVS